MRARADIRIRRAEDGFTLVELLAAMTISLIVLLAALQSLDVFATSAARQTRQTDANDQVRAAMDRTVADLRGASQILTATATDLAYAVPETSSTNRIERLCVASSVVWTSSSVTSGTPAAPSGACGSAGHRLATLSSTSSTAFTYDGATSSATPALVKNVGLTFSLDATRAGRSAGSTLQASAVRRSSGTLPITPADVPAACSGTGHALLSLSATIPNVAALSVTYSTTGGVVLGATTGTSVADITLPSSTTTIVATVTDALGVTNTISKDVTCAT